mmetsp:Transcript_11010/g.20962  ORF Transcript_11010/g.20962 Transcript_11010/m.20962 type:complete len:172 (-) Transcript_11010:91-606(-)|eukprot:scaffold4223_cov189-Amphora_coffeaeformis.AAC.73
MVRLSPKLQQIINTVAALADDGRSASRNHVMLACGYTDKKSTGFVVALSNLKKKFQCLVYDANSITLTDLGQSMAEPVENISISTNRDHMANIRASLKGNKGKMVFDVLSDGKIHTRDSVAMAVGYKNAKCTGFSVAMSQLVSSGFMEYCENEKGVPSLLLTDAVFPFGRP